jgi:hypothetical protein
VVVNRCRSSAPLIQRTSPIDDWRLPPSDGVATIGGMERAQDPLLRQLDALIQTETVGAGLRDIVPRVRQQLDASGGPMSWRVLPLTVFGGRLPESVRSCWIFMIRAGASTSAERHPNSHQRSCSLFGSGTFEVYDEAAWRPHALTSGGDDQPAQRSISIPQSTWHRLRVGPSDWGMVSFHTVAAEDLIEENPLDPHRLDGPTRQQRYAGRQ